ncbi:MAG: sodium/solute symporter [Candidatus Brocadiae bacterium]|nr:sodium/solute symporter [Candidatus Brocadiia bacterium]
MVFGLMDIIVFLVFVICVVSVGMLMSRNGKTGEDYFLAGRGLSWWLIGFSLIAANISTEQFVGMSGNAASHVGIAIASYEWMAAITLVVVAFGFLPYFLRAGIYTIPEFLEYRYNATTRTIMAVATLFIYMLLLGSVTYSGALTIRSLSAMAGYNVTLAFSASVIGVIAMLYVCAGGLKACAWADLIQGSALILGGALIMFFAFQKLGTAQEAAQVLDLSTGAVTFVPLEQGKSAMERFFDLNRVRMNMFLPSTDSVLPWTALLLGLWIPNFYYWGLNQYITQRTLGSASLAQGQKGIVFAAFMKLIIPLVIVIPGIIAFNLFAKDMQKETIYDNAKVFAKYAKANPQTLYVTKVVSPKQEDIDSWKSDKFMLAIFDDAQAMKKVQFTNAFVLPLQKAEIESISVSSFVVFETDDKSAKSVFPSLMQEIEAYNAKAREEAKKANAMVSSEKFIAYKYDTALAQLLGNVIPQGFGLVGFVLAALLGAVVSSLAAMLNAASTIFSMDIYQKYISPKASQDALVRVGRISVVLFTIIAIFMAPQLGNPQISHSIFTIIQEGQGFISPGILAVFVFGFLIRKAPPMAGVLGLLTNIVAYGFMKLAFPDIQFLNRMAICFALCIAIMSLITLLKPLAQPIQFKQNTTIRLETSKGAMWVGIAVVIFTLILYVVFSPLVLVK